MSSISIFAFRSLFPSRAADFTSETTSRCFITSECVMYNTGPPYHNNSLVGSVVDTSGIEDRASSTLRMLSRNFRSIRKKSKISANVCCRKFLPMAIKNRSYVPKDVQISRIILLAEVTCFYMCLGQRRFRPLDKYKIHGPQ